MLANYSEFGFHLCAERFPDACTSCPFWWYAIVDDTGMCAITTESINANGAQDIERMPGCPIERWPRNDI